MKQTTVYLIRHGMYENPDHLNPGRSPGFPLSSLGKQEVVTLATLLSQEPISAVFSSPILRTRETAEMLARNFNLPVSIDDRLSEVGGPFNGVPSTLTLLHGLESCIPKNILIWGWNRSLNFSSVWMTV
jgi:phosphohistidine phosphatase SixA